MSKKIAIVNYDVGNLFSLFKAIEAIGYEPILVENSAKLKNYGKVILPGVGSFDTCYNVLLRKNFISEILSFIDSGKNLMGICVGMQLLFTRGFEGQGAPGLGIINGKVREIINNTSHLDFKLPHIGWNSIKFNNAKNKGLFTNLDEDSEFYFVHSYCANSLQDNDLVVGTSDYLGNSIIGYIEKNNVFGCQFHPEKSRKNGLDLLRKFAQC
ncbi:MAG TPA: imidazole glycerol phosphate synthase subunit HisH [Gammaproteobacteria bacterium]|nr:imidazole glycerol phosphate synthase subunit HisH [Gammaproteobacteria bacterium]